MSKPLNIEYLKAGWINNQSAKGTVKTIDHLIRLCHYAGAKSDTRLMVVAARLLRSYAVNEPKLFLVAIGGQNGRH